MVDKLIHLLPVEIRGCVLSYLYFSHPLSKIISNLNESIRRYKTNCLYFLRLKYETSTINYYILMFFLYDKKSSDFHKLNYDVDNSHKDYEVDRVFNILTLLETWRLYKYICFNGESSEKFTALFI